MGMMLGAAVWWVVEGPTAVVGFLLVLPPALALRLLPAGPPLDGVICTALLGAQLGAGAGLTTSTGWWDNGAHAIVGALLALLARRILSRHSASLRVGAVVALELWWELGEWAVDLAVGTDLSPGLVDTASDLALGIAGALVGTVTAGRGRHSELGQAGCVDDPAVPRGEGGAQQLASRVPVGSRLMSGTSLTTTHDGRPVT